MPVLEAIWEVLNTPLTQIAGKDLTLLSLVQIAVILALAAVASRILTRLTRYLLVKRLGFADVVGGPATRAVRIAVFITGVYLAFTSVGFDLAILLVPLGGLSVGVGLGTSDIAKNVFAGLVTISERRVRRGQRIEVRDFKGVVESVGLRSTTILLDDGDRVILANADFMSLPVRIVSGTGDPKADAAPE